MRRGQRFFNVFTWHKCQRSGIKGCLYSNQYCLKSSSDTSLRSTLIVQSSHPTMGPFQDWMSISLHFWQGVFLLRVNWTNLLTSWKLPWRFSHCPNSFREVVLDEQRISESFGWRLWLSNREQRLGVRLWTLHKCRLRYKSYACHHSPLCRAGPLSPHLWK